MRQGDSSDQTFTYFSLVLLGVLLSAVANARPDWVSRTPQADSGYRYYVGRASDAANESLGFGQAVRDAYEQAIKENYGFQTRLTPKHMRPQIAFRRPNALRSYHVTFKSMTLSKLTRMLNACLPEDSVFGSYTVIVKRPSIERNCG